MTATRIRPAGRLDPRVAGIRTTVERHAGRVQTAIAIRVDGADVARIGSSARRDHD